MPFRVAVSKTRRSLPSPGTAGQVIGLLCLSDTQNLAHFVYLSDISSPAVIDSSLQTLTAVINMQEAPTPTPRKLFRRAATESLGLAKRCAAVACLPFSCCLGSSEKQVKIDVILP